MNFKPLFSLLILSGMLFSCFGDPAPLPAAGQKNAGKKIRFRNRAPEAEKRFETVPGYENCSLYLNFCKAASGKEFEGKVFYREKGTSGWLSALDLVYIPQEKAARSSIVKLQENTAYELKLELNDNQKKEVLYSGFRTKNSNVPVGKTVVLNRDNFKGHLVIDAGGSPDGYIRYTAAPGFILNGVPGKGEVIFVKGARYVILDGLTVRGNSNKNGILISGGSDVQVLNCDISGYSLAGTHRPELDGKYYNEKRKALNYHSGIYLKNTKDVLVERCYIHDPAAPTNPWFYSHPAGPNAVMADKVAGLVLRYNDFVGNDLTRWNDAVEGGANGFPDGGPNRDAEIKGNYFALSNDDGIELDGGQMNTRMYYNKFENTFCGVSTAPCLLGPSYVFYNLFTNPGDQFEQSNAAFKNNHGTPGYGRVHFIGNTAVGDFSGISRFNGVGKDSLKGVFYNNLFAVSRNLSYKTVFDDCLYFSRNLLWTSNSGARNQMREFLKLPTVKESLNEFREPVFVHRESGDYRLRDDSPGKNSAVSVPNFQARRNADIGAVQEFELPYRPLGFRTGKAELQFDRNNLSGDVTLSADETFNGKFRIVKNFSADFLTVTPSEGELTPGKKIRLNVVVHPGKLKIAKKHKTVFLVRSETGLSRPVSVVYDNSKDSALAERARKNVIYAETVSPQNSGGCTLEFKVAKTGKFYVFVFVKDAPYAVNMSTDGKEFLKGKLYGRRYSGWHWCALLPEKAQEPNRPFDLRAGETFKLYLKQRWNYQYQIKNAALAATPEEMLYAPEVE